MKPIMYRALVVPTLLLLMMAPGCHRSEPEAAESSELPSIAVTVQAVAASRQTLAEEVVGTVRAALQARIEAKVSGRIVEMRAVPGETVQAGALLARLEVPELRARLDQARAVQGQAGEDLRRFTALLERQAVTRAEFEAVQARARVAEASVAEAETMLGYAEVSAPFNGVITRKLADVGDLAAPGRALLEMEDPAALRFEADIGEALIDRVQTGQVMTVTLPTLHGPLEGTVAEVAPAGDPATRTFAVKLDLPATPGLRSGVFGRVAVPTDDAQVLLVPFEAVLRRGQLEYVFVRVEGRARLRLVKTGRRQDGQVELLAGAAAGEEVVVSGASTLREGQPLNVQP